MFPKQFSNYESFGDFSRYGGFPLSQNRGGEANPTFLRNPMWGWQEFTKNPTNKNSQKFMWELIKTHQKSNQQKPW